MEAIIEAVFGIKTTKIVPLSGYDNRNYCVYDAHQKWILKTYTDCSQRPILEAECEALDFLSQQADFTLQCPQPQRTATQDFVAEVVLDDKPQLIRLLSFVEGAFLGDCPPTRQRYTHLGIRLGELNQKLAKWTSPVIQARQWAWNMGSFTLIKPNINLLEQPAQRMAHYFIQHYEEVVVPQLSHLPKTTLYNDANEWNILCEQEEIIGMIDFGDLAYGPRIHDLAVAMVYAAYDKEDPLDWACLVLQGFHQVQALQPEEIKLLYHSMALRLCMSLCNSAVAKTTQPENTYATYSEKYALKMLNHWLACGPLGAEKAFLKAVGLKYKPPADTEQLLESRKRVLSDALSVSYQKPIPMNQAAFQYMYAADGSTFLDAYNNIPHVGHHHPVVVEAAQRQLAKLNTNTRYLYPELQTYAEALLAHFPKPLDKVFLVNSGSEASDLAIRIARSYTGQKSVVVMEHGYHGNTQTGIEISDYKFSHPKGMGQQAHIIKLPLPKSTDPLTTSIASAKNILAKQQEPAAAFISETILGCAGQVPLPEGYLQQLYPLLRQQGSLCIADEVQTGFGRLGDYFWAFEQQGVIPDLVVLGKPMGNGFPMGAVVTTSAIAERFAQGVEFFSSFGGNPVSCVVGKAVLEVLKEEQLPQNAQLTGEYFMAQLRNLQKEFSTIHEVRGQGLFLGVELRDPKGRPHTRLAQKIKNELREKHILISTAGPYDHILKSKPPLCFDKANVDQVIDRLYQSLKNTPF